MSDELSRRIADELEIRNLVSRLAQLADDGDLDEYLQCFTEDAVWDGGAALGASKGHEELLAAAKERRRTGRSGPGSHSRHVVTTQAVTLDGDTARSRAVFHYYTGTDATPALAMLGVYEDRFARSARGWCLAERRVLTGL